MSDWRIGGGDSAIVVVFTVSMVGTSTTEDASKGSRAREATTTTGMRSLQNDRAVGVVCPDRSEVAGVGSKEIDGSRQIEVQRSAEIALHWRESHEGFGLSVPKDRMHGHPGRSARAGDVQQEVDDRSDLIHILRKYHANYLRSAIGKTTTALVTHQHGSIHRRRPALQVEETRQDPRRRFQHQS